MQRPNSYGMRFCFSGERRPLSDWRSAEVSVTSLGRARLMAAVQLCTGCRSQSALFPLDRVRCSVQLALDSPVTQLTRPPSSINLVVPPADSRVKSWTSCG